MSQYSAQSAAFSGERRPMTRPNDGGKNSSTALPAVPYSRTVSVPDARAARQPQSPSNTREAPFDGRRVSSSSAAAGQGELHMNHPLDDHLLSLEGTFDDLLGSAATPAKRTTRQPYKASKSRGGKTGEWLAVGEDVGGIREESMFTNSTTVFVERKSSDLEETATFRDAVRISYAYTTADVQRRPRNTVIGMVATFILVFFSGLIILGICKAPYVLLRLAELSAGEMDVVLYGGNSTPLIDFPAVNARVQKSPDVQGSAPRWIMRAALRNEESVVNATQYSGAANLDNVKFTASNIIVVDSLLEESVGIGRGWPYRPIGYGEAQVYYAAADYIGVKANRGERISLMLDVKTVASALGLDSSDMSLQVTRPTTVNDPLSFYLMAFFELNNITSNSVNVLDVTSGAMSATMVDAIKSSYGKYSSVFGNVILLDVRYLVQLLLDESCVFGPQTIQASSGYYFPTVADLLNISSAGVRDFNLEKYAMLMVTMLADRYPMYYSSVGKRNRLMTEKTNSLMNAAGLDFDGSIEYPVALAMDTFDSFRVLLVSSFIMVIVCVIVLGCILMFTLLRINADERQFELAMIRAQGMPRKEIIAILVAQTMAFAVPGTVLGILFVYAANAIFEVALKSFTKAPARPSDLPVAVGVVCAALGIIVPLAGSWAPIRRALGGSLRDALDVYRQADTETRVIMQKLEEMGLATWQVLLGFFLLIAGFMVYYLMPLSFVYANMMMFFILLEIILLIMIVGFCMMFYVLEPVAESCALFLLLWRSERKLGSLIRKNLRSHQDRNSKAYMMFLLTVACLSAAGAMFAVLATISSQLMELTAGAPITVTSSSFSYPLDQTEIDEFLRGEGSPYVSGWAYSSFPLASYPQVASYTRIANFIGGSRTINVVSVSETFMDGTYKEYTMVKDYNKHYGFPINADGKKDVVRSMYEEAPRADTEDDDVALSADEQIIATGLPADFPIPNVSAKEDYIVPMLVSSAVNNELGVTINTGATLRYSYRLGNNSGTTSTEFYVQPRALMKRVSGFVALSSLPTLFRSGSILLPEPYFKQLLDPVNLDFSEGQNISLVSSAVVEIRQKVLYVRLRKGVTEKQRETFANALQAHTNTLWHSTVDTQAVVNELKTIKNLIMYFFYFTAVVSVILCAFMLWVTFISNVQMNSWSLGVLQSLGFRSAQLVRASIYEALCVVLAAFTLGLLTGVAVGLTLAAQFAGYLVLPFKFDLPYQLIIIILGLALLSAFIGPVLPFIELRKKAIATILRGI